MAYDSLYRKSELVSLEFEDVLINEKNGSLKLKLQKSKTDPHGIVKNLYLSNEAQRSLKEWIDKSGISSRKIFRAITVTGKIRGSLNSSHVGCIYKKLLLFQKLTQQLLKI